MSSVSICCRSSSLHQQYQPAEMHAGEGTLRHLRRKMEEVGWGVYDNLGHRYLQTGVIHAVLHHIKTSQYQS